MRPTSSPHTTKQLVHQLRHLYGGWANALFVEGGGYLSGFEVNLNAPPRAAFGGGLNESCRRIHHTGGANGDKDIRQRQRLHDLIHVHRHLTKPDDVRTHATRLMTGRADSSRLQILSPSHAGLTLFTAHLQQL